LHNAKGRFLNARNTLDDISTSASNDVLLVPLNSSLYVPGKIVDHEKVSNALYSMSLPAIDYWILSLSLFPIN
jgi:hypothetical protein